MNFKWENHPIAEHALQLERDLAAAQLLLKVESDAVTEQGKTISSLQADLAAARAERDQWRECAEALFCDVAFECDNPKELEGYKRFDALKAQEKKL